MSNLERVRVGKARSITSPSPVVRHYSNYVAARAVLFDAKNIVRPKRYIWHGLFLTLINLILYGIASALVEIKHTGKYAYPIDVSNFLLLIFLFGMTGLILIFGISHALVLMAVGTSRRGPGEKTVNISP